MKLLSVFLLVFLWLIAGAVPVSAADSLGEKKTVPSPAEIARERHEGRALRDQARSGVVERPSESIDPAYLDEMDRIYNTCAGSSLYSTYYDCRCQAVKFLDARIKRGPNPPTEYILSDINTECANVAGLAGYAYELCTGKLSLLNYKDKAFAPFCECFANAYARSYAKAPRLSSRHVQLLQKKAYQTCGFGELRN